MRFWDRPGPLTAETPRLTREGPRTGETDRAAGRPYRYAYNVTGVPGAFLFDGLVKHDLQTGREEHYALGAGVYGSETVLAPRNGSASEDDGYLVTFVSDLPNDRSECWIFSAQTVADGPIARVRLPERIASGTHACWAPASALQGW